MLRYFALTIFAGIVIGGIFVTYGSQDDESAPSLDDVKFREVRVIPSSELMHSLMPDADIAALGEMVMSSDEDITAYGFSDEEKTLHQKFFTIGNLYADLLSKLSGEYDKESVLEKIKVLRDGLDSLDAPNAIYIYLFNLESMIIEDEYPREVIKRFLAMLYPFIQQLAQSAPSGAVVSLQAGHWLVDFGIAAAGEHETLARQSETALFFADTYAKLDAPKGVMNAFREIAAIASKPEFNYEDFEQLMMLSEDIRGFLR